MRNRHAHAPLEGSISHICECCSRVCTKTTSQRQLTPNMYSTVVYNALRAHMYYIGKKPVKNARPGKN